MIDPLNSLSSGKMSGAGALGGVRPGGGGATAPGASSFADMLRNSIDEVSRLQQDASTAVDNLAAGKTEDVTGVMSAVEKSDMAFKTLLSIRSKLMAAYEEIKSINV